VRYEDATAFRQALEQRLKDRADGDGARLCPSVVEGDDDDSIFGLDEHIDDDQPAPRSDQRSTIPPDAGELLAGPWEFLQREQRA
jgi:hypothetical protein